YGADAVPHLVAVMAGDAAAEIRAGAAHTLGELGAKARAATAALAQAASDPDLGVSQAAETALEAIEAAPPPVPDSVSGTGLEILHYTQDQ
ncbi:MAG: HEAT repeat domain-containing protein, partial [Alphaproteobacteria bacterium]